jgi:hypothetical protein
MLFVLTNFFYVTQASAVPSSREDESRSITQEPVGSTSPVRVLHFWAKQSVEEGRKPKERTAFILPNLSH